MQQQNTNLMNSSNNLPISSLKEIELKPPNLPISSSNEIELKPPDVTDRDTGDLADNIKKQQQELNDKATKIIEKAVDKSKEILTTVKNIFKL